MKHAHKLQRAESRFAAALLAPVMIYLLAVVFFPLLWGVTLSFTGKVIGGPAIFNGLDNYRFLLTNKAFLNSVGITLGYTALSILFKTVFGILLALLLNMEFRGRNVVRALLLIPWTLPNLVAVLNWRWIFSDTGGVLNRILQDLGIIGQPVMWLGNAVTAFIAIIIVNVWRGTPFFGITILSKLQTIPKDWYEAASMDGANALQQFFYITLPSIKDITLLSALVSTIWTINDFEAIWLLTGGGPVGKTAVLTVFSYTTAMQSMQIGKAIAVSVLAMPILILLISGITKISSTDEAR